MFEYKEISHEISVTVRPEFCEDKSNILSQKFVFIYHITIESQSSKEYQLIRRAWLIKDDIGDMYEINGEGVVGKQPIITVNNPFTYQSYCVLKSPSGSMEGFYQLQDEYGESIKIKIPRFYLRSHLLN